MTERFVVVGGDAAGMSAAATARRRRSPDELEIVVFERSAHTSYAACGLPYYVGDVVGEARALVARTPEQHRAAGIDVRTRHEVLALDLERRRVRVRDLERDRETTEPFDHLCLAVGARPVRPPIPGIDASGVFGIQHLDDGIALRRVVEVQQPQRAVIVGGGYIGIEMAEALVRRGLRVCLVEALPAPMPTLDPDMGALVADALVDVGVQTYLGEPVQRFETGPDGRVRAVVTAARELPADLVVLGLGVRPDTRLAAAAGLAVGESAGIVTDERQRTSAPGVWAAGDCVETRHLVSGRPVAIALGTHANKQGRVVGIDVTGGDATFPGVLGTAVAKLCDLEVARTGLTERQATELGLVVATTTVDDRTRAGYYPGAAPIRVKLVWEEPTGRLLGAQIVGREGAAKRVDVLAACLWNRMTVDEILSLDLGYAPPFSPVWDPVLAACRVAVGRRERRGALGGTGAPTAP